MADEVTTDEGAPSDDQSTDEPVETLLSDDKSDDEPSNDDKSDDKSEDEGEKESDEKADDKDGDDKDDEADKNELIGAPEEYDDFKVPDGMEVDQAALGELTPLAKEMNLSQAGTQKLVDLYASVVQKGHEAQQEAWTETQKQWVDTAKADTEIGGDDMDGKIAIAKQAITAFSDTAEDGSNALKDALEATGYGNHPEIIRFFYRVGKELGEDGVTLGGGNTGGQKTAAEILFPDMN